MSTNVAWRISDVLKTAKDKQVGFKASYFMAFVAYMAISVVIELTREWVFGSSDDGSVTAVVAEAVIALLMMPLGVGLGLLGIRRASGRDTPVSTLWEPYTMAVPLLIMFILMGVLIVGGLLLLILPGIYLAIAYSFAPYLIIEKGLGVWESLETSRKAITQYWWRYFGLMLVSALLIIAGIIPLFIGLIWVLPIVTIAAGEVFVETFNDSITQGVEESEEAPTIG
ncbi:MAG: hypothetical protein P8H58_04725 [Luminiphilus sp.]|nr:hypothetical protein [Luminiphilus sp.]